MAEPEDIKDRTFRFALAIISLVESLPDTISAKTIGKQLIRSGTSVGANVEEATAAHSKNDFIYRMNVALREARETLYWLRLLDASEVLDATRIVDLEGVTLWEGGPLGAAGARTGTILAAGRVVDDPGERRLLHERTGADAVDMESGPLARSGRLAGCLRAISDTPARTLGPLANALGPDGRVTWSGVARALGHPRHAGRALGDVRRALRRLEEAAA